ADRDRPSGGKKWQTPYPGSADGEPPRHEGLIETHGRRVDGGVAVGQGGRRTQRRLREVPTRQAAPCRSVRSSRRSIGGGPGWNTGRVLWGRRAAMGGEGKGGGLSESTRLRASVPPAAGFEDQGRHQPCKHSRSVATDRRVYLTARPGTRIDWDTGE